MIQLGCIGLTPLQKCIDDLRQLAYCMTLCQLAYDMVVCTIDEYLKLGKQLP
jgi:hypothetical protein